MTKYSVLEFADDIELNFEEISLPETTIDFSENANMDLDDFFEAGQNPKENQNNGMKVVEVSLYEEQLKDFEDFLKENNYTYKVK